MCNLILHTLLLTLFCLSSSITVDCPGNRFQFLSTYSLGRQLDLTYTFSNISGLFSVANVSFKDVPYRTYTIFNFRHTLSYAEAKQSAQVTGLNTLKVSNGTLRVSYTFDWEKKQLGSSLIGNGTGTVTSNIISYEKVLSTNASRQLQWHLSLSSPISITNGLTLGSVFPYKEADYEILGQMLNALKNNQTTVKANLLYGLNLFYVKTLEQVIERDPTLKIQPFIIYRYSDYRGQITINYTNSLRNSILSTSGLTLQLSQSITDYDRFECGDPVPQKPDAVGGQQQFLSNSLLRSTIKYAIEKKFLDVVLEQQFWQSRAFQFRMGDVHEVLTNTKKIDTLTNVTGRCSALNDSTFDVASAAAYRAAVNFTCVLNFINNTIVTINMPVVYEIKPKLMEKYVDFSLTNVEGVPTFNQETNYQVYNLPLAQFMVTETILTSLGTKVLGSGYKSKARKNPALEVRNGYLFLYDGNNK